MTQERSMIPVYKDPDNSVACRAVDREEKGLLQRVIDQFADYCRARSLWVLHYCTGCGAIELPPTITARFDLERIGVSPMATPRQADILLITGYLAVKTLKRVVLTYEQMQGPKYVIGLGSCTINGGMYWHSYATIKQLGEYIPVDTYIAGCMPRPEAIQQVFLRLMEAIDAGRANAWQDYYRHYDRYLGAQQRLFGADWHAPVDVVAEAGRYGLIGEETLGPHTAQVPRYVPYHERYGVPLDVPASERAPAVPGQLAGHAPRRPAVRIQDGGQDA